MASETQNIGLYKANPVQDPHDVFNFDRILNDNWDKLDSAIGARPLRIKVIEYTGNGADSRTFSVPDMVPVVLLLAGSAGGADYAGTAIVGTHGKISVNRSQEWDYIDQGGILTSVSGGVLTITKGDFYNYVNIAGGSYKLVLIGYEEVAQ